jgi:hypothetical protein
MNFAFELQKDKRRREDPFGQSYKLISLRAMQDFYATVYIKICNHLSQIEADMEWFIRQQVKSLDLSSLLDELPQYKDIPACCAAIELVDAKKHADEFLLYLSSSENLQPHELKSLAHALKWQIIFELENRKALLIPASRAEYYKQTGTFLGQETIDKIGRIGEDAEEAGNCFAVGRYTACVFHLGRVVERCLQDFGVKTGISLNDVIHMQWQEIINKIRSKLNEVWPKHKDPNRQPYENLLGHLETVKNAWRVPTVHPKMTYTDDQAEDVMTGVKAFVRSYVELLPLLRHLSASETKSSS